MKNNEPDAALHPIRTLILFILLSIQAVCQPTPDFWEFSFNKQNITWDWRGKYQYNTLYHNGLGISLKDNFTSNLIKSYPGQKPWRDEHRLNGYFFKKYSGTDIGIYADSWYLSDQQSGKTNRYSNHALGIKSEFISGRELKIAPYAGYQRSEYLSRIEWGWDLGMRGEVHDYKTGDYYSDLNVETNYDFYQKRRNAAQDIELNLKTNFSDFARDSISLSYGNDEKQYFSPFNDFLIDLNIENRGLFNRLSYRVANNQNFELNTILSARKINDNTPANRNERQIDRFENRMNYFVFGRKYDLVIGLRTFQEIQDNLGRRTDSEALQTGILTNFNFRINPANRLNFQISYIKFQYNTPDSITNNDDRDEQRFISSIYYEHQFSPVFIAGIEFYTNFYHQIYIFREQSANNNWNRILRIKSTAHYNNRKWSNKLRTEVLANYTVYDFEELFTTTRSFIFRKYILSDSLDIPLAYKTTLGFHGRVELEDKGSYFKQQFSQRIIQSTESFFYDVYLIFKKMIVFDLEGGISYYSRRDWQHIPSKRTARDIRTFTPYLRLKYGLGKNLTFNSYAAITFLDDKHRQKTSYITGKMNLLYSF